MYFQEISWRFQVLTTWNNRKVMRDYPLISWTQIEFVCALWLRLKMWFILQMTRFFLGGNDKNPLELWVPYFQTKPSSRFETTKQFISVVYLSCTICLMMKCTSSESRDQKIFQDMNYISIYLGCKWRANPISAVICPKVREWKHGVG